MNFLFDKFTINKMRKHLISLFEYNDWANRKLLETIKLLPEKEDAMKLFSHLISAQDKWFNRISKHKEDSLFNWFGETHSIETVEQKWNESYKNWNDLLKNTEIQTDEDIIFKRPSDDKELKVRLEDLILQLNYHSIHHVRIQQVFLLFAEQYWRYEHDFQA